MLLYILLLYVVTLHNFVTYLAFLTFPKPHTNSFKYFPGFSSQLKLVFRFQISYFHNQPIRTIKSCLFILSDHTSQVTSSTRASPINKPTTNTNASPHNHLTSKKNPANAFKKTTRPINPASPPIAPTQRTSSPLRDGIVRAARRCRARNSAVKSRGARHPAARVLLRATLTPAGT